MTLAAGTALARTSYTAYDADNNVISTTDALGNKTTMTYDLLNRLVATTTPTQAGPSTTSQTYDANGNVLSVTDGDGNTTTYTYDILNRQTSMTDAQGHTTVYAYDQDNNLVSTTDALGRTKTMTYDVLNRLTSEVWTDPTGQTAGDSFYYSYDADNNVLTATDSAGTVTMTYDLLNRESTVTDPFGQTLVYSYDADNNVVEKQDSQGGTTTSVYDIFNELTSRTFVSAGATLREDFAYNADGNMTTLTRYSDAAGTQQVGQTVWTYDAAQRVSGITATGAVGACRRALATATTPTTG